MDETTLVGSVSASCVFVLIEGCLPLCVWSESFAFVVNGSFGRGVVETGVVVKTGVVVDAVLVVVSVVVGVVIAVVVIGRGG